MFGAAFHPLVETWFEGRFAAGPTPAQLAAWPAVAKGGDVLVCAPTGSGKTLAAFLYCLDGLVRRALDGGLEDRTEVVYVSPLKALSNDVQRNLELPAAELRELAEAQGLGALGLRIAVRTGDTPANERRLTSKHPPHVLVTTPESLFILLTSESGRRALGGVRTVIVDEIHAVAGSKRGSHLALSVERLEHLVVAGGRPRPQRIGLSATVRPLDLAARLLSGAGERNPPTVVDLGPLRELDLAIEVPKDELGAVCTGDQWEELYERVAELAKQHRSTLVFVNTRRLVEKVTHHLSARLGENAVGAHHGSMSRQRRFDVERRLKHGELKVVVATASLELGIDVGAVELTCLLGTPRSIGTALQRIGRSGHAMAATPKGRLFPLTRDQLVECAAIVKAAKRGVIDATRMPVAPLDVLAQQIVALCACEPFAEDELFALVRRAWPYAHLERTDFDAVVGMLSEGISTRRGRPGAMLHRDGVGRVLRGRRGARLAAITSGGAIPDNANYDVILEPDGVKIGTLDEDFAIESMIGDIFLLGNTSWRIRRVEAGKVRVEDARGAAPSVPFWLGEAPARTRELSAEVGALRREIDERLSEALASAPARDGEAPASARARDGEAAASARAGDGDARASATAHEAATAGVAVAGWLMQTCALDRRGAELLRDYIAAARGELGAMPNDKTVVAERFFDEAGGMQLVIHAPFGAAVNRAWGLSLRKRFCRMFDFELQAAATDDGVLLSLGPEHSFPLDSVFEMLRPADVHDLLVQAAIQAPMFGTRWRWNASRALALLRFQGGRRVPPALQRMRANDLMAAVFPAQLACQDNHDPMERIPIPDHPLVAETLRDCLSEAMDAEGLARVLEGMRTGTIATIARETPSPSVLSHEILNANPYAFLDDAPLEERRARAVTVRRGLPAVVADRIGGLDPDAVAAVVDEARPDVRNADELHDLLLDLVILPERDAAAEGLGGYFDELVAAGRAARARMPGAGRTVRDELSRGPSVGSNVAWVAAERRTVVERVAKGASFEPDVAVPPRLGGAAPELDAEGAFAAIARGWMAVVGPVASGALAARLGLAQDDIDQALLALEGAGLVLRGRFSADLPDGAVEWCDRVLLARIHRRTVERARADIQPVTAVELVRFLLGWQHARPRLREHGRLGVARVAHQLQGFELAAAAWERDVLAARIADYDPGWLDELCLSGELMWGRLSPREVAAKAAPNRASPITIARRRDLPWLLAPRGEGSGVVDAARDNGARANGASGNDAPVQGQNLSHAARDVLAHLEAVGASFLDELTAGARRLPTETEDALWELVAMGRVTSDSFAGLRALLVPASKRSRGPAGRPLGRRGHAPLAAAGRWSLLRAAPTPVARGPVVVRDASAPVAEGGNDERIEALARQYIRRYGVMFRDLLAREPAAPTWRDLLRVYRRLEMRGELRGGRLVDGFVGEQFAAPEAVDSLRATRREGATGELVRLSACDPLNVIGILTPGPRVAAHLGNDVFYRDGAPLPDDEGRRQWLQARGRAAVG